MKKYAFSVPVLFVVLIVALLKWNSPTQVGSQSAVQPSGGEPEPSWSQGSGRGGESVEQAAVEPERAPTQVPHASDEKAPSKVSRSLSSQAPTPENSRPGLPRPLSSKEIEEKKRKESAIIERHLSSEFVQDDKGEIHWLHGVIGSISDRSGLPDSEILFEKNGIVFYPGIPMNPTPSGESGYQAIYDSKRKRPGVVTGIVVMASDAGFDPAAAARSVGIKHSSSRPETGIHFFDSPEGSASDAERVLQGLRKQPGVLKAQLALRFDRKKAL